MQSVNCKYFPTNLYYLSDFSSNSSYHVAPSPAHLINMFFCINYFKHDMLNKNDKKDLYLDLRGSVIFRKHISPPKLLK